MQDCVIYLSNISGLDPIPYTSYVMQETPFLLQLVLNPLAEGFHYTSPSLFSHLEHLTQRPQEKLALAPVQD
jgi:hypothetical protein